MKVYNTVDEVRAHIGCFELPKWYLDDHYLVVHTNEPYCFTWLGFLDNLGDVGDYVSKCGYDINGVVVLAPQVLEVDVEQYIKDFKHLIGCEFRHNGKQKGKHIQRADLGCWNISKCSTSVQDNCMYIYQLKNIKIYIDDYTLGTYEEYMQVHYPEYRSIWEKQL